MIAENPIKHVFLISIGSACIDSQASKAVVDGNGDEADSNDDINDDIDDDDDDDDDDDGQRPQFKSSDVLSGVQCFMALDVPQFHLVCNSDTCCSATASKLLQPIIQHAYAAQAVHSRPTSTLLPGKVAPHFLQ
eukprot:6461314-Amphidinium_carterae.1